MNNKTENKQLIETALIVKCINQKELAVLIGVSPTLITKLKQGEKMSPDVRTKLMDIVGEELIDPEFLALCDGKAELAHDWSEIVFFIASQEIFSSARYHNPHYLCNVAAIATFDLLGTLVKAGLEMPEINKDLLALAQDNDFDLMDSNASPEKMLSSIEPLKCDFIAAIQCASASLASVANFIDVFIDEPYTTTHGVYHEPESPILAISNRSVLIAIYRAREQLKLDLSNVEAFSDYEMVINQLIGEVKSVMYSNRIPFKTELNALVNGSKLDLIREAYTEKNGTSKKTEFHPDYYENLKLVMLNDLLVSNGKESVLL